jgi:hypothetical protein
MRFNVKDKNKQTNPKRGNVRSIEKFLWFPRKIGNQIVWLETVIANQKYDVTYFHDGFFDELESIGWETFSYELIEGNDVRGYASKK